MVRLLDKASCEGVMPLVDSQPMHRGEGGWRVLELYRNFALKEGSGG